MALGGAEMVFLLFWFLTIGLALVAGIGVPIDASSKPEGAFEAAGSSKTLWIVMPLVLMFFCGFGAIIAGIVWIASVRPRVVAVAAGRSAGYATPSTLPPPPAPPAVEASVTDTAPSAEAPTVDESQWAPPPPPPGPPSGPPATPPTGPPPAPPGGGPPPRPGPPRPPAGPRPPGI